MTDTKPAYGSVESFANIVRENCRDRRDTYISGSALARSIVDDLHLSVDERLRRIRNALDAAELVRKEMTPPNG